ncbi:TIR domain-containing protein [Actinomadura nitritigenes]|uniref:TIR domain-containing protein n=1 Tax=Actinomadura nitritigenes TaxID=134602 RepID=UPI003D947E24
MPTDTTVPHSFFTSYAHRADEDLVRRFHADLAAEVGYRLGRTAGPGFLDQEMGLGTHWEERLYRGACAAKVMVVLATDDYFASTWCGREWSVFAERARRHTPPGAEQPAVILPLRWIRLRGTPPAVMRGLQWTDARLGTAYNSGYLLDVMREDQLEYARVLHRLGDLVSDAVEVNLARLDPDEARKIPLLFPDEPDAEQVPAPPPITVPVPSGGGTGTGTGGPSGGGAGTGGPPGTPGPPEPGTTVPVPGDARFSLGYKTRLVDAIDGVAKLRDPQSWEVFLNWVADEWGGPLNLGMGSARRTVIIELVGKAINRPDRADALQAIVSVLALLAPDDPATLQAQAIIDGR